ncbi:MAG: TlyA family RNA methyltransferase [Pseudomonadota bacterium]
MPDEAPRRLDQWLVARGLCGSRAQAQAAIKAGRVALDGRVARKPNESVPAGANVEIAGAADGYASRGAEKLAAALDHYGVDPDGLICLDLGASTGGFTDLLLRRGAARIYAVDVGRGQLIERLAGDPRVVNLEGVHGRDLTAALAPGPIDLLTIDVSFISLAKAAPAAMTLVKPGGRLIALVKPQFELGRERIGKGGKALGDLEDAPRQVRAWLEATPGWRPRSWMDSPILGGAGAQEFLIAADRLA